MAFYTQGLHVSQGERLAGEAKRLDGHDSTVTVKLDAGDTVFGGVTIIGPDAVVLLGAFEQVVAQLRYLAEEDKRAAFDRLWPDVA